MRPDMFKVIVDRPRFSVPGGKTRGRPVRDSDEMPAREGMRRRYKVYELKLLNDHLAPLRRYLTKQVGRPWDKVFSEICKTLRLDSTMQRHLREHVADLVSVNGPTRRASLYVDVRTGLLRSGKRKR
jgi:hypothetical protein